MGSYRKEVKDLSITNKIKTYINPRFFKRKYDRRFLKRKLFDRNTALPLFLIYRYFYVHKGLYFRKHVFDHQHLGVKVGTVTVNRKPFAQPIKRVKLRKGKRVG